MTRISILTENDMNDEQRSVIEYSSHSGQPHGGPYWAYIRNPKLMRIVQDMNRILTEGTLTANELSIIVLTVARHWSAKYPWAVQVRNALKVGLGQNVIDAINGRAALPTEDARENLVHKLANELLADQGLSDASYAEAEALFTTDELITVIARIGAFSMTCCTANGFDITPPDEVPARLQ